MHIQILSESARSKHPIPATIEKALATVKPKARVVFAQPGRYVLKSRTGLFSIFRISKEAKYTPSMKNRLFAQREMEALASDGLWDIDPDGPYSESITDLEAEALSFEEDFLRAKGIDVDEDFESESASYTMYGYLKFKNGKSLTLGGDASDFAKAKSLFKGGSNPVVSLTDGGLGEDEADLSVSKNNKKLKPMVTPGQVNTFLKSNSSVSFESDSAAPARGKGNVGSKLGRKKRAPGMLAPGWHVFNQPASGGPMRKYYAGPRIAARRIASIMNGEEVPEGRKKSPNETASKTRKSRITRDPNTKTLPASSVKQEVTKLTEGKTLQQMEKSLAKLKQSRVSANPKVVQGLEKAISRQLNKVNQAQRKIHNLSFQIVQIENILKNSQDLTPAKIAKFKKGLESRKAKMKAAEQEAKQANNGKALPMRKKSVSKPAKDAQTTGVSKLSGDYVDFYESSHKKAVTKALTDSLKDAKLASKAKIAESGATLDVRIKGTKSEVADDVFRVVLSKLKEIGKEKKAAFQYKVERSNGRISGMKIYARETKAARSSVKRV